MMKYTPGETWQETPPVLTSNSSKRPVRRNGKNYSGYANFRDPKYFSFYGGGNSQLDSFK